MLGISSGLVYPSGISDLVIQDPTDISNLIGWWDFTDASSMYTDAGSTNVSSNGDLVERVDNKAYTDNNSALMVGRFMTRKTTSGDDYANKYTTGGSNSKSYICFADHGGLVTAPADAYGGIDIGGGNYRVSTSVIKSDACTYFAVTGEPTNATGSATSLVSRRQLFNIDCKTGDGIGTNVTLTGIGVNNGGASPDFFQAAFHNTAVAPVDGSYASGYTNGVPTSTGSGAQIITVQGSGNGSSIIRKNGVGGTTTGNSGTLEHDLAESNGTYWELTKVSIGHKYTFATIDDPWEENALSDLGWGTTTDLADDQTHSIYEIILYNKKLDSLELSAVETHLKNKYGI